MCRLNNWEAEGVDRAININKIHKTVCLFSPKHNSFHITKFLQFQICKYAVKRKGHVIQIKRNRTSAQKKEAQIIG